VTADSFHLEMRRSIRASPQRLFEAWTTPAQLVAWWGPEGVRCTQAEVDARPGGHYAIHNELPDGRVLVIRGAFKIVEPPHRLVYTWTVDGATGPGPVEQVSVQFVARGDSTEVVVVHERILDEVVRDQHALGWTGCLEGLAAYVEVDLDSLTPN
jgi:uncharacterized protein YndB with AHSA1/START domain